MWVYDKGEWNIYQYINKYIIIFNIGEYTCYILIIAIILTTAIIIK